MKTILKLPFAALAALLLAAAWPAAAADGAVPAPAFTLASRAGGHVSLADLEGQVVMINFWASWCGPCRQEFPALDQIYAKYKPMGFTLVAINVESEKADAEKFLGATPVTFPILFDPDNTVSGKYGVSAMPTTVLVDRQGRVRWQHRAYKPGDEARYIEQIRAALREKA
ncbi:MAG TPA: TlpA disulfide reductase family protein [Steroidobacteraceae bacterium]|nr:TlpA disulfide reductase family protein [Steroidobacteraceae bacterium]